MRSHFVIASILIHAGIAFALMQAPARMHRDALVTVEIRPGEPRPVLETSPPKTPPPPVKIASAMTRSTAPPLDRPLPPPAAPSAPSTGETPAPFDTGIKLGNGGDGMALPPASGPLARSPSDGARPSIATTHKTTAAPGGDDGCPEPPSKPVVLDKPTNIDYSPEARANGVEGRLVLKIVVAADGSVDAADVVEGVEPSLDAVAIAAVRTWRFKPALRCGKPIGGGQYTLARRFELGD